MSKTFVVAVSWDDYYLTSHIHRLDPAETFYAASLQEARRDVRNNANCGIDACVLVTDDFRRMNPDADGSIPFVVVKGRAA